MCNRDGCICNGQRSSYCWLRGVEQKRIRFSLDCINSNTMPRNKGKVKYGAKERLPDNNSRVVSDLMLNTSSDDKNQFIVGRISAHEGGGTFAVGGHRIRVFGNKALDDAVKQRCKGLNGLASDVWPIVVALLPTTQKCGELLAILEPEDAKHFDTLGFRVLKTDEEKDDGFVFSNQEEPEKDVDITNL